MSINVSSWFYEQLYEKSSSPFLRFYLNNSDHGPRVVKWPTIKTDVEKISPSVVGITLVNADGLYNGFYQEIYTTNVPGEIKLGYTHPTSGDEEHLLYKGQVKKVDFEGQDQIKLNLYNKFYEISKIKIGQSDAPVSFSAQIPSDIAWSLCTSYGGLSLVESSSNPDIDHDAFLVWAETFSADSVTAMAHYTGEKISEALEDLARQTDSYIFVTGEGKITFERFTENASDDLALREGEYSKFRLSIDATSVINKQYVSFDYSVNSDYWQRQIFSVNTASVNSFGLQEDIQESEYFWYVNSVDALTQANRKLTRWATPPRKFELTVPLIGMWIRPADNLRFVNSFFQVDSSQGWRIASKTFNLSPNKMSITFKTNEGYVADAFYLDIHNLDGDEQLL